MAAGPVALDLIGGAGALGQTFDETDLYYDQGITHVAASRQAQASTFSFAYGAELPVVPVRHVVLAAGLRALRLTRDIPISATPPASTSGDMHLMVTFTARAAW